MQTNLKARINGKDVRTFQSDVEWKLNVIEEFSIEVHYVDIADIDIRLGTPVEVYIDGTLVKEGFAYDRPELKLEKDNVVKATIKCYQELGGLMCYASLLVHYQDANAISVLSQLLAATTDYELGDVSTFPDPGTTVVTLDLRSKETLWSQIVEVVNNIPDIGMRYGGFNTATGRHRLDVGAFGEIFTIPFVQGDNIITLERSITRTREYSDLYTTGGESADEPVTLDQALAADPSLATDPLFPILLNGTTGEYYIHNNAATATCGTRRSFTVNKTENDEPPTDAEKEQAALALYQHGVRFLQEHSERTDLKVEVMVDTPFQIGDLVYIYGHTEERVWDIFGDYSTVVQTMLIDGYYYIINAKLVLYKDSRADSLVESPQRFRYRYQIDLSDTLIQTDGQSIEEAIVEKLETHTGYDNQAAKNGFITEEVSVSVGPGLLPDCSLPNNLAPPTDGISITIPVSPPSWATVVTFAYVIDPPSARSEVTQNPTTVDDLILCVSGPGGTDWTIVDDVTVNVIFTYLA